MRLTGGLDRGRRLFVPRGSRTRPTASKVREAIFNILGPPPGPVLDLYAGSGALGLEALSRGAASAVFVERDGNALSALRRNLRESGMEARGRVIAGDVRSALRKLSAGDVRFSWVFMDPPYVKDTAGVLAELSGSDALTSCAVVIVEHDKRHPPPDSVGCLFLTDRRAYGDTELSFYRCSGS
jgi:16S rRNA (guanine966-N2)-methyltransferase